MSGSSNNSWTIVTPEGTAAAETPRPLAQAAERQDEPIAPADGFGAKPSESAHGFSEEDRPTSEVAKPNKDGDGCSLSLSAPSEVKSSPVPEAQAGDTLPVDSGLSSTEPESFSDSYSHLGPSSEQTPASALTAETLGHLDSGQEEATEQTDVQDETLHQTVRQELQPEEEDVEEESKEETQQCSPIETPQDPTVQSPEAEPEMRRRRLAALEKIGRHDEEEEAEEHFQLPQRDADSGITLNMCILGAVILLGLGTIFISGVFMDLDQENDYSMGLKDSESSGKPELLNPDMEQPGAEAGSAELLNKLNKGNEQLEMLQAQLQFQREELKVAKIALEKIRTELESVPVLQQEVETLRSTLTQSKFSAAATTPSSGRTEDNSQRPEEVHKKEKHDRGVTKEWKDAEKAKGKKEEKQRKDGGKPEGKEKEWKREKSEGGKFDKRQKEDKHSKQSDETEGWKDKAKRGDEGKPWKEKKEKKEWTHEGDKKHKDDKNKEERSKEESKYNQKTHKEPADKLWKKGRDGDKEEKREWIKEGDRKHKRDQFKEERRKEERDVKEGEYHQEKHKGPGDKHWKNGRDNHKDERKEKYEKKHWKESDGYKSQNRKDDGERREKGKDQKKWKRDDEKERMNKAEERNGGEKYEKERHGDETETRDKRKDQAWTDKKAAHAKPALGQPEYWARQRARLQHSSKPPHNCDSPDSCARAEGVRTVPFAEFESVLMDYLSKAQTAGVEASQIDALQKLAAEMFPNGVFPHDKMSFQDYVEDIEDILEDLVEAIEDEMEGFEEEVMQKFVLSGLSETDGEVKEKNERVRG